MLKVIIFIHIIFVCFFSTKSFSYNSSSYLIANTAMMLYDYEKAKNHYNLDEINNFNSNDLVKKLIAHVISGELHSANLISKELINIDFKNQEAWLVYLVYAKNNNNYKAFTEFEAKRTNQDFKVLDYVFYKNSDLKQSNIEISKSIFDIINSSTSNKFNDIFNYEFLLFYLSLCIELDPSFDEAYFYIAQLYQRLGNYNFAEKFYNKINTKHFLFIEGQKFIALNKKEENNFVDAESDLLFLLKNYPDKKELLISIGDLYRTTKNYKKAILYYSKILNKPEITQDMKWQLLYMRGICYERINNWESAESDFLQSLKIKPDSPQVLNYLAYGWLERNIKINESLKMLVKAHNQYPDSYYILDSLAWGYFKINNLDKASSLMEEVLFMAPWEAISLDHLGDIYFAMGRKREAYYMWKQAKDLATHEDNIIESVLSKIEKYESG